MLIYCENVDNFLKNPLKNLNLYTFIKLNTPTDFMQSG